MVDKRPRWLAPLRATSIIYLLAIAFFCVVLLVSNGSLLGSWKSVTGKSINRDGGMEETVHYHLRRLVGGIDRLNLEMTGFSCHADLHTEICLSNKPVRVANNGLEVYIHSNQSRFSQEVRPYARREDPTAMKEVTPVKIVHGEIDPPPCDLTHNVTALIFSSGGFSGNTFHEINEIVIPLFLTSRDFRLQVQFVVTDYRMWLVQKYRKVLARLSNYEVLDLSKDERVHCFPGAVLGLKYHDNLALNPNEIPGGHSMPEFKRFVREAHELKVTNTKEIKKPKLMLISRHGTRKILNERSVVRLMEQVGFQVVVANDSLMLSLEHFVETVNSCSVMVGVHGAGLAHELFLPNGAVLIQIVPLGMEWSADTYFGKPGITMGLRYLPYKIAPKESSLSKMYSPDHPVITDPDSIFAKGYNSARAVYVDKQDIMIDLVRFRKTLAKALKLAGRVVKGMFLL